MYQASATKPAQHCGRHATPFRKVADVSRLRRALLDLVVVIAFGVVGFVIGWSTVGSGGLENYYRSGLAGMACGLLFWLVLILARKAIRHRHEPPTTK